MANKKILGTEIHGIAASEHMDSSGESISIEGVDISSLTKDGVFNFEHQSKEAQSIVGKITEAKKIFKKSDCTNETHKYFWDKIQMPYIYVRGELFDKVGHQAAKDLVAMLKYDNLAKEQKRKNNQLIGFSIEGSKLDKKGPKINKCIARKISITITPCNKVCEAESVDKMLKTEYNEVNLCKEEYKDVHDFHMKRQMRRMGEDAYGIESSRRAQEQAGIPQSKEAFEFKEQRTPGMDRRQNTAPHEGIERRQFDRRRRLTSPEPTQTLSMPKQDMTQTLSPKPISKSLEAGSMDAAPSTLTQGSALQIENLSNKLQKVNKKNKKNKENEAWKFYSKKEELLEFLADRYDLSVFDTLTLAKSYVYNQMQAANKIIDKL